MFAKFACVNLAAKIYAIHLLNSGVVIYLLWSGISFSTAAKAVVLAKLVILGVLLLTFLLDISIFSFQPHLFYHKKYY